MSQKPVPSLKPYTKPVVQEQGKVAAVTHQTPTPTPVLSGLTNEFDEF